MRRAATGRDRTRARAWTAVAAGAALASLLALGRPPALLGAAGPAADAAAPAAAAGPDSGGAAAAAFADTAASPAAAAAGAVAPVPYGPGERLVFSIDYGPINAGEGVLEVRGVVETDGHACYLIESRAQSNRFFSAFYMVRDKVVSHIDVQRLFSRYYAKRLREGDYRKNVEVRFDQDAAKAHYADGRVFDTPPAIHDELSAFYYARTLDLQPGKTYSVNAHSSRKNYPLQVLVHGRERVKVPAGEFDCLVVEPVLEGEGLFQHEGKLTIWMTDDARKMPVLMKTKVKVGSIDASLREYRSGAPLTAGALPGATARSAAEAADPAGSSGEAP